MKTKKELRDIYQNKRDCFSNNKIEDLSMAISNRCLDIPIWNMENFHVYLSILIKKEIDTSPLLSIIMGKDKQVIIPKMKKNKTLESILLTDQIILKKNKFEIPEPQNGITISPLIIDVIFVPLYIFDKEGNRVGYGGGYYDRFLKKCKKDCIKVGLSLFEPIEKIKDVSSFDVKLNYGVTPESIFSF